MSDTHWAFRASAVLMTNFLSQKKPVEVSSDPEPPTEEDESDDDLLNQDPAVAAHLVYESDVPDDEPLEDLADDDPVESSREAEYEPISVASNRTYLFSKHRKMFVMSVANGCIKLSMTSNHILMQDRRVCNHIEHLPSRFCNDLGWPPCSTVGQGLDQAPGASHVTMGGIIRRFITFLAIQRSVRRCENFFNHRNGQ